MQHAGIHPQTTQVHPAGADLIRITGAQAPSGTPVVITAPEAGYEGAAPASHGRRGRDTTQERRTMRAARRSAQRRSVYNAAA
ncbi:hypothetical protein [Actinacidiphila glaucinigra]